MHQEQLKTCSACGAPKPLGDFYKHPNCRFGRQNKCKDCHKRLSRENRAKNVEACREHDRRRAWNPERVAARRAYQKAMKSNPEFVARTALRKEFWRNKNAVKARAYSVFRNAVKYGRIKAPKTCQRCNGGGRIEAHHENYYKPLDVVWLCCACHGLRHREINAEIRAGADYFNRGL